METILRDFPHQFDTKRLTIRCPMPGDGREVQAALVDSWAELRPWMAWAKSETPQTLEQTELFIRRSHIRFLERADLQLLLFLRGSGTLVGSSGLHRIDWDVPKFEIGYWVRTPFAGQGYISEAVQGITNFAFAELGANRLEIRCDAGNQRSAAVAQRTGFSLEATLHWQARDHFGKLRDTLVFAKLRDT